MRRINLRILVIALATSACAVTDTGLGNAVRQNMAAQVIDPDPQYRGTPVEAGSGARAALAMRRYREGRVIEPRVTGGSQRNGIGNQNGAGGGAGGGTPPR